MFAQLVGVDEVLPKHVGGGCDGDHRVEEGLCHPDGEDCVLLSVGLSAGHFVVV